MILVKSLIVIFLMLFVAKYFYPFVNYMSNTFDGREGFADGTANGVGANEVGANEVEANGVGANEDEKEETTYTPMSPAEKQAQMANDASVINDLQLKIAELQELSDKATDIRNELNTE